jgi:hypothetical protein
MLFIPNWSKFMYKKEEIEQQAEREAEALRKIGKETRNRRIRLTSEYNQDKFDKLFIKN